MALRALWIAASITCLGLAIPGNGFAGGGGNNYRLTNMNDINLGTWLGSTMTGNDPVCVYKSPTGNARYGVTGTDTSTITPGAFRLQNGANTVEIPYTVSWNQANTPGGSNLTDGASLTRDNADRSSQTCSGGTNANFRITVDNANIINKPSGVYTTTLTFVVAAP